MVSCPSTCTKKMKSVGYRINCIPDQIINASCMAVYRCKLWRINLICISGQIKLFPMYKANLLICMQVDPNTESPLLYR